VTGLEASVQALQTEFAGVQRQIFALETGEISLVTIVAGCITGLIAVNIDI
jgi:hypothetical protein